MAASTVHSPTSASAGPALTVAICTFNRAELTIEAVRSVLAQLRPGDELLVVDNASTDDTAAKVRTLVGGRGDMRVVAETQPGLSRARNRALAEARTSFVIYLDDDATARPGWLEAYREFVSHPRASGVGAVGGPVDPVYEVAPPRWFSPRENRLDLGPEARALGDRGGPWGCNFAVNRGHALFCGGFDPAFGVAGGSRIAAEETELFVRLRISGASIWWLPGAVIDHKVGKGRVCFAYFWRSVYGNGRAAARQRLKALPTRWHRVGYRIVRLLLVPFESGYCAVAAGGALIAGRPETAMRNVLRLARMAGFACEMLRA